MYCGYRQPGDNFFRKNNSLLGLLVLPVVLWFSKTSVFSSVWSSLCPSLIWYICIRFFWLFPCGQKYAKIKVYTCWKRHNKKWTFRFFEKFYRLNLLDMILNESPYNFRFLLKTHPIYIQGSYWFWFITQKCSQSIKMQHFLNFNTHETMELWSYFFFLWVVTLRANQLI